MPQMPQPERVIVLDNGGCSCKFGLAGQQEPILVPNCTARAKGVRQTLTGAQLSDGQDLSTLKVRRPVEKGYVINWDLQRDIWSHTFANCTRADPASSGLLLTEPLFSLPAVRESTHQIVFEEFGFPSVYCCPASLLSLHHAKAGTGPTPATQAGCGLVLDAGFSFTHAVPVFDNVVLDSGIRRLNLGGKLMTNYLKELVSYRSVNLMEESYLVEHIKDSVCFVSTNLQQDLKLAHSSHSPHKLEYVLPDGFANLTGFVRKPEPAAKGKLASASTQKELAVALNNERFLIPELLFNPSDVSLAQAGVAELIVEAVSAVHPDLQALLYSNIVLSGGSCCCPGFKQRLMTELRPLVPDHFDLNVVMPDNPITCAWQGGSALASTAEYNAMAMTRTDYEEQGYDRLQVASSVH